MVLGGYVLILAITAVYFIPNLMGFMETPYQDTVDEALVSKASMWETLSIVRMLFILALAYMLVSTLTRSRDEIVVVQPSNAVPLSYPNDALGG